MSDEMIVMYGSFALFGMCFVLYAVNALIDWSERRRSKHRECLKISSMKEATETTSLPEDPESLRAAPFAMSLTEDEMKVIRSVMDLEQAHQIVFGILLKLKNSADASARQAAESGPPSHANVVELKRVS